MSPEGAGKAFSDDGVQRDVNTTDDGSNQDSPLKQQKRDTDARKDADELANIEGGIHDGHGDNVTDNAQNHFIGGGGGEVGLPNAAMLMGRTGGMDAPQQQVFGFAPGGHMMMMPSAASPATPSHQQQVPMFMFSPNAGGGSTAAAPGSVGVVGMHQAMNLQALMQLQSQLPGNAIGGQGGQLMQQHHLLSLAQLPGNMIAAGSLPPPQLLGGGNTAAVNPLLIQQAIAMNIQQQQQQQAQLMNSSSASASVSGHMNHFAAQLAAHNQNVAAQIANEPSLTGRPPMQLYMSCDDDSLSEYQCLVRKHIELFEALRDDVDSNAQGRNRPIVMGQVGIRCRHCTMLIPKHRARGAIYYPAKLQGLYQAAQNMASSHLCEHCQHVPMPIRAELLKLKDRKSSAGGGKKYWADGVRVLGVLEDEDGLRFEKR